ncbi:hypothetical protein GCM10009779_32440 [Polymorphospora rubra]
MMSHRGRHTANRATRMFGQADGCTRRVDGRSGGSVVALVVVVGVGVADRTLLAPVVSLEDVHGTVCLGA